jgi:hypothetical protein
LPDVTIRRPSLSLLSIRLVHRTLIVHFNGCFLLLFVSILSMKALSLSLRRPFFWPPALAVFSFTFAKKSLTSFCTVPSVS